MTTTMMRPTHTPAPHAGHPVRRTFSLLGTVLTIALFAAWLGWMRPAFLGGSTGYVIVSGTSMHPTLHNHDVVLVQKHDAYKVGDIIAYRIPKGDPGAGFQIIHRIIGGSAQAGYMTQGDNRTSSDQWRPKPGDVIGSQAFHIGGAGKAFTWLKTPAGIAAFAGLITLVLLWGSDEDENKDEKHDEDDAQDEAVDDRADRDLEDLMAWTGPVPEPDASAPPTRVWRVDATGSVEAVDPGHDAAGQREHWTHQIRV